MDGWITIGTELDTKELEKDLKEVETRLKDFEKKEKELTKVKAKIEAEVEIKGKNLDKQIKSIERKSKIKIEGIMSGSPYEQARKVQAINSETQTKINDLQEEYNSYLDMANEKLDEIEKQIEENTQSQEIAKESIKSFWDNYEAPEFVDEISFDSQIEYLENKIQEIREKIQKPAEFGLSVSSVQQLEVEEEKLTNQLIKIKEKQQHFNEEVNKGKYNISSLGNSMSDIIKKVAKWTLAIFSVRSAYMFVRQAMSTLTQYDDQLAADIEYIRYALANALYPVIKAIVQAVMTILQYINYISSKWFGKELFASAKSFQDMKKSASGTAASVKQIKKELAGFDEMNVLQEDGSVSAGGVAGGITAPSVDFANWDSVEIPEWVKWIANNKDTIIRALEGIAGAILAFKFASFISGFLKGKEALSSFADTLGKGLIYTGIMMIVGAVADLILNWDKLSYDQKKIDATLVAIGASFIVLGVTIRTALSTASFGLLEIIGLITALVGVIGTQIALGWSSAILETADAQNQLRDAINNTQNAMSNYIQAITDAKEAEDKLREAQDRTGLSGEELYKTVLNNHDAYQDFSDEQKEVLDLYLKSTEAQAKATKSTEELTDAQFKENKSNYELQLSNAKTKESYEDVADAIIKAWNDGTLKTEDARDLIEKAMSEMSYSAQIELAKKIPEEIGKGLDPNRYQNGIKMMKNVFNDLWGSIGAGLDSAMQGIKRFFGFSSGGVTGSSKGFVTGGVTGFAQGGVNVVKMASGSIISQPGRGVPMTKAIGGEAGHEGIIPLTNSQMMTQLGEEIGRNVNITLTNVTKLDNRQIAREQRIINAQSDFASNR